jgi:hypothetical protein
MGKGQLAVLRDQQLGERNGVSTCRAAVNSHDHMAEHRSHFHLDHGTLVHKQAAGIPGRTPGRRG